MTPKRQSQRSPIRKSRSIVTHHHHTRSSSSVAGGLQVPPITDGESSLEPSTEVSTSLSTTPYATSRTVMDSSQSSASPSPSPLVTPTGSRSQSFGAYQSPVNGHLGHSGSTFRRHSSSQRRSSFLAGSMLKESVLMHRDVGRDGSPTFSLRLTESQGFWWNQAAYDMHNSVFEDDFEDDVAQAQSRILE